MIADMTKLDAYLRDHGISGRHFAALVGLSEGQVSRIRRGHVIPETRTALAIERATNGAVPVSEWAREDAA